MAASLRGNPEIPRGKVVQNESPVRTTDYRTLYAIGGACRILHASLYKAYKWPRAFTQMCCIEIDRPDRLLSRSSSMAAINGADIAAAGDADIRPDASRPVFFFFGTEEARRGVDPGVGSSLPARDVAPRRRQTMRKDGRNTAVRRAPCCAPKTSKNRSASSEKMTKYGINRIPGLLGCNPTR